MAEQPQQPGGPEVHDPSPASFWTNFLGIMGTITIFLIIALIVYIYTRPPVDPLQINQLRYERRESIEASQERLLSEVRQPIAGNPDYTTLPIEEAMRKAVREIRSAQESGEVWRPPTESDANSGG
ncbi:MAG: hypothetical protein ACFB20_06505 [Opitutales bacterium]